MRLSRSTDEHRIPGRPRPRPTAVPDLPSVSSPGARGTDPLADERRMRSAGGPVDNATYTCGCGLVFEAPVTAGVECPVCGTRQAW